MKEKSRIRKLWPWILVASFWIVGYFFMVFWFWIAELIRIPMEGGMLLAWRLAGVFAMLVIWGFTMWQIWRRIVAADEANRDGEE